MRRARGLGLALGALGALSVLTVLLVPVLGVGPGGTPPAAAVVLPSGFQEQQLWSGLTLPTVARFSGDGRVWVAEKQGLVKVFDSLTDLTPTTVADLRARVFSYSDRGLLGLAVDPQFPTRPYLYVLYSMDAPIGGTPPVWNDTCPTPPGAEVDGCVTGARLSRLTIAGSIMTAETVLIEDWCMQYVSHTIGTVAFGGDGALYVSGGDGAQYSWLDYGQGGGTAGSPTPKNPCGDPPGGVGAPLTPPTAEGGTLRSQDLRTPADPTTLDGTIIRVHPDTGLPLSDNPSYGVGDLNRQRIVAYGLRNPFRFTVKPGTNHLWTSDVGWDTWEELNVHEDPTARVRNFGWPCYEGTEPHPAYVSTGLNLCSGLYAQAGAVTPPHWMYRHGEAAMPGDTCTPNGGSVTGLAFYTGGTYPAQYDGALFIADFSRRCIWVMLRGPDGRPDPNAVFTFAKNTGAVYGPTDLTIGPGGDVVYVDTVAGVIKRIRHFAANQPPVAAIAANRTAGPVPLFVQFDGTASSDPEGTPLTYAWDLDGDGAYDDSPLAQPLFVYQTAGSRVVGLRVRDPGGLTGTATITITAGSGAPDAAIVLPASTVTWAVGDAIHFAGQAFDPDQGWLPASALTWTLTLRHCWAATPTSCHSHPVQDFVGVASGSFVAPDHEYPAHLELRLRATDAAGLTDEAVVTLQPRTSTVTMASSPPGLALAIGSVVAPTPFTFKVITGSRNSVSAGVQSLDGLTYHWDAWSDGSANAAHDVVITGDTTLLATLAPRAIGIGTARVAREGASGTRPVQVWVGLSRVPRVPVTVQWSTANGTATSTQDYVAASGTLRFPPGVTWMPVTVQVRGDAADEVDETLAVNLAHPTGATIVAGFGRGTVTIVDDDDVTYTARFGASQQGLLDAAAAWYGVPTAQLPYFGMAVMAYLLALDPRPPAPVDPPPANVGPIEVTTSYGPAEDATVVQRLAGHWSLDGDRAHFTATYFLLYAYLLSSSE